MIKSKFFPIFFKNVAAHLMAEWRGPKLSSRRVIRSVTTVIGRVVAHQQLGLPRARSSDYCNLHTTINLVDRPIQNHFRNGNCPLLT
jgi:hypothetical protein